MVHHQFFIVKRGVVFEQMDLRYFTVSEADTADRFQLVKGNLTVGIL